MSDTKPFSWHQVNGVKRRDSMKGLTQMLKSIPEYGYAYIETTPEKYKAIMREVHHPKHKKSFTCEAYTAIPARGIGSVQILVRVQRHE